MKTILSFHSSIKIAITIIVVVIFAAAETPLEEQSPLAPPTFSSALSSAFALPGIYVSYNMREGYRKFDAVDDFLYTSGVNPFMFGLSAGKRFALKKPRLRIQTLLEFGWGSAEDGVYPVDESSVTLHSNYLTTGVQADAHLLFHSAARTFFLSAGPGLHLTWYNWVLKEASNKNKIAQSEKYLTGSPSINVGAGMEYRISQQRAVAIGYNLRFWRVARYEESGALFPMGVDYREFFFSHSLQAQVLIPGPRQRNFQ
jgi:hypothetical protein